MEVQEVTSLTKSHQGLFGNCSDCECKVEYVRCI